jgi:hypothetical protein
MWLGTPKMGGLGALGVGAFFGVFFGVCMTAWVAIVRRRDGAVTGSLSRSDRVQLNRAARAGEPPADPALDQAALALIERRRGQVRWSSKAGPWIFGAMALIGVMETVSTHSVVSPCLTVADVGLIIVMRASTARQTTRLDLLERAIRERSADGPPSASGDAADSSQPSDIRGLGTRGTRLIPIVAIVVVGLVLTTVDGEKLWHERADSEVDGPMGHSRRRSRRHCRCIPCTRSARSRTGRSSTTGSISRRGTDRAP